VAVARAAVAFAPDGQGVATAGRDSTARLWGLSRLRSELAAAAAAGHTVGTVTVQLGANDLFVVAGLAPAFGAKYLDFYAPILGREKELTLIDDGYNVHLTRDRPAWWRRCPGRSGGRSWGSRAGGRGRVTASAGSSD
jgi:hypothetical protein